MIGVAAAGAPRLFSFLCAAVARADTEFNSISQTRNAFMPRVSTAPPDQNTHAQPEQLFAFQLRETRLLHSASRNNGIHTQIFYTSLSPKADY
jgi:hypothetical protein